MMGDNRDNSTDSRAQWGVGYVPFENLVGRAEIIFFSAAFDEPDAFRLYRALALALGYPLGTVLHLSALNGRATPNERGRNSRRAWVTLFKSRELFNRALTHASVRSQRGARHDNERLEFVGDRVLGLAVADMLFELHPDASEGELARRFNRLVRGQTCASVARKLGLGPYLILSESEAESGGREKETMLPTPSRPSSGRFSSKLVSRLPVRS